MKVIVRASAVTLQRVEGMAPNSAWCVVPTSHAFATTTENGTTTSMSRIFTALRKISVCYGNKNR